MAINTQVRADEVPYWRAMTRFPSLRQSTLQAHDLCALEALWAAEVDYLGDLDDIGRLEWGSHAQHRGQAFHRWAHKLLDHLAEHKLDALADDVECPNPRCQNEPNLHLDDGGVMYVEGNACPLCRTPLIRKALTDVALEMLYEVLRPVGPAENVLLVPQEHVRDLEWTVCKFAREQRFEIDKYITAEHRYHATLTYPNPAGGVVERVLTGQLDAMFAEQAEDGSIRMIVLDWKHSWGIPGATSISTEGYFQQRMYAWLVMKNEPTVNSVMLDEVYPMFKGGDSGQDNHRKATVTRAQLPKIERQLAIIAERFDRTWEAFEVERELRAQWDGEGEMRELLAPALAAATKERRALARPTPGSQCNYCPKPQECPIIASVRVHGTIETDEDAERVAGELVVAKRIVKHRETALRGRLTRPTAGERPTARARKATGEKGEDARLPVYKDNRPGLPEGIQVKQAKGRKVFTMVEGTRKAGPKEQDIAVALEKARAGVPVDIGDLYRVGASSTLRLVEESVPVDDPDPVAA